MNSVCLHLLCCWLCLPAFALRAQENFALTKIEFSGNKTFSAKILKQQMQMHTVSRFKRVFLRKPPFLFSKEILESDLKSLTRFYQSEGFLHVALGQPELKVNHEKRSVELRLQIQEGEPVRVAQAPQWQVADSPNDGVTVQALAARQASTLALQAGVRFRDDALRADAALISRSFANESFPHIRVEHELVVEPAKNRVGILWQIAPGTRCVFGETLVTGNTNVASDLIRSNVIFKQGQLYDQRLVEESQQDIYGLGLFRVVTMQAVLGWQDSTVVPIRIHVREAPRLKSRFGLGYGNEDKLRVFADLQILRFPGGARRLHLFAKHSALEPYNLSATLTNPNFWGRRRVLIFNPYFRRQKEPGFDVRRAGIQTTVDRQLSAHANGFVSYLFEKVENEAPPAETREIDESDLYNKSGITTGLSFDNSLPLFTPSRGINSMISFEVSGLGFSSPYHFCKALYEFRRYQELLSSLVFAYRAKVGALATYKEGEDFIPEEERFYAGGSTSIRGWGRSQLGPLDVDGNPAGGNSLFELGLELRYPIYGIVSGVAFGDFGNVWEESFNYDLNELHYSFGAGLRFKTLIGPVRIDAAWPVFDEKKSPQFHLDVGHAF